MMTSREIVQRTINYDNPERVARSFLDSDFRGAGCSAATHATEWREVGNGGGNVRMNGQYVGTD